MAKRYERTFLSDTDIVSLIDRMNEYYQHYSVTSVVNVDGMYVAIMEREIEEEY